MATPQLTPAQITQIWGMVGRYINTQRAAYNNRATELSIAQKNAMREFFADEVIDGARLVVLEGTRVQNPDFYPELVRIGFRNLPNFAEMDAITFQDTVVSHVPFTNQLLFHELVHVVQYRQLGVNRFAELYVKGFLQGGGYDGIPLEIQAYALDRRYAEAPGRPFAVENEVSHAIQTRTYGV